MMYEFVIDGLRYELSEFYNKLFDEPTAQVGDLEEKMHELLETGSVTFSYTKTTYAIVAIRL